jgi:hypothetical protein
MSLISVGGVTTRLFIARRLLFSIFLRPVHDAGAPDRPFVTIMRSQGGLGNRLPATPDSHLPAH